MRIAVNTRLLLHGKLEGIGRVEYELLSRITRDHPEHEFIFIFDKKYSEEFIFSDNVKPIVVMPPTRAPILMYLFFEWSVYRTLKKHKADIFISPDGWVSLRSKVPTISIIHDLNFEYFPEFFPRKMLRYYQHFFHKFAKRADKIVAVSEYTKQDIIKCYDINPSKVDVVYNACSDNFHPISEEHKVRTREKYTDGCEYFIFVGSLHKRKNLVNLFLAFDNYKDLSNKDTKLVIVGNKKWWKGDIENTYNTLKNKSSVIFTGFLSAEYVNDIVASAIAELYISFFEGFGIPILEAFNAETAVITSNTTSMPEVAGDAAIIVDPYKVDEIVSAMIKVESDVECRNELILKGRQQSQRFCWDNSAKKFWNIIETFMTDFSQTD